jgi:hypothetical protein
MYRRTPAFMTKRNLSLSILGCILLAIAPCFGQAADAPRKITTPKEAIGFNIGDDYHMANYVQLTAYWQTLAKESDRMKLVDIGPTAEGRRQYMAIISSPENLAKLDHYKEISAKLSHAEGLTDQQAHALAEEGRAVVWIDGGLHASETVGSQQLIETVYQLNALTDPETMRFLRDDIVLCVLDNPDGMDLVADWYMREPVPEKRKLDGYAAGVPRLWHKYAGHDNNRDFYMNNMPETTNISHVLFREWYPQIMYNHHQTGPLGAVIFMPPFRDPFNYHYDPLITLKIQAVGTAMHERLVEEGKPGSGMRSAANYSTWYNGGLRTVTYFHNMTGILTEIIGSPTPMQLPLVPARQLPTNDLPDPVAPQLWHYRQSIEYELTNNRAILDYASREREHLLYDTYRMGKNSIERGSEDSWTITPKRIEALDAAAAAAKPTGTPAPLAPSFDDAKTVPSDLYTKVLHDPAKRDPRGYILSADQPDFPTATKFVNALLKSGVTIEQATADFTVAGKHYTKGSYVVMTAQAYRPHVLDLFEPQDHPNDFAYPGGPPNRPYDATGWTLAFQMGIQFDRELDGFTGPFEKITTDLAAPLPGSISGPAKPAGYLVSHEYNDAFTLTNRLLKAGQEDGSRQPGGRRRNPLAALLHRHQEDPRKSDAGTWHQRLRRRQEARGRCITAAPGTHRALRPVRRPDAFWLDSLAARTVRILLHRHLSAGSRCRQPDREVRRHPLQRRSHQPARKRWPRLATAEARDHSRGVPPLARGDHAGEDDSSVAAVRRRRWHPARYRKLHQPLRISPPPARKRRDRDREGQEHRHFTREVLYSRLADAHPGQHG